MYIDARKFDYSALDAPDADKLTQRDKAYARRSYRAWMEEAAEQIVERQWEIDDIGAVERTGAFVRLLREAEFTYALGAYTSAIALVGICAEDLCRFFANSAGHNIDDLGQAARVQRLQEMGAITQEIAAKLHGIRRLRNDCLHYNDGFRQRPAEELKANALEALNTIKAVYARIVGVVDYRSVDVSRFLNMTGTIAAQAAGPGGLGVDEAVARTRNLFGSVFGIDLSLGSAGRPVYSTSIFNVIEIDAGGAPPEVTLEDVAAGGMKVIVDLTASEAAAIGEAGIREGDLVAASLMGMPNGLGMSGLWRLWSPLRKLG